MKNAKDPNRFFVQIHLTGHSRLKTDGGFVESRRDAERLACRLRKEYAKFLNYVTIEDMHAPKPA